jgi:hypothetical protein
VNIGRSLPDTWNPGRQLYWHPERSFPTGTEVYILCEDWLTGNIGIRRANPFTLKDAYWLLLHGGPLLLVQCQLISINKWESGEEQHHSIRGPFIKRNN